MNSSDWKATAELQKMNEQENIYQSSEAVATSGTQQIAKNSKLGVASCVLSTIGTLGAFSLVGLSVYWAATGQTDLEVGKGKVMLLGFGVLICLMLLLVGFVLGVIGLFQKEYRRTLAILGTTMSAIIIFLVVALIWIGLSVE